MLIAESLSSVSYSIVVKIYITFCDFKIFCSMCFRIIYRTHDSFFREVIGALYLQNQKFI